MLYWLPVLVWGLVIFSFSAHSNITVSTAKITDFVAKKAAHFSEYFILSALIYRALHATSKIHGKYLLLVTLTLTVLYAITDEFHQSFTPGRSPRIQDVIIDSGGAFVALVFFTKWLKGRKLHFR